MLYFASSSHWYLQKISRKTYGLYLHRSCLTDELHRRLFRVSCQQPWLRLVELENHTHHNNSLIQDYVHPDDQTQPFEMTPGFKPFTVFI